jgi:hypothetical protein
VLEWMRWDLIIRLNLIIMKDYKCKRGNGENKRKRQDNLEEIVAQERDLVGLAETLPKEAVNAIYISKVLF